jgi:phosphoribosylamine--glycine ligase
MKILVFGSDSCAHALAWKLVNSNFVEDLILAPGNGGTAFFAPSTALAPDDHAALTSFVLAEQIDLVVADSASIAAGVADEVGSLPLPVFGSSRALERLQRSRCAAREWLQQHGLPLPRGRVCSSYAQAEKYAATLPPPLVIAADAPTGPALICTDRTAVPQAIDECMDGGAGSSVIVEELVTGPLVTASILTDGATSLPLPAARLYPAAARPYAGATGVHGAATPLWSKLESFLTQQVRQPLLKALQDDAAGARGWIGATCVVGPRGPLVQSLHLTPSGLEAVATLLRLDGDLLPLLIGCARGTLAAVQPPQWRTDAVAGAALCRSNVALSGPGVSLDALAAFDPGVLIFHHATTPTMPNTYVPLAARFGGASLPKLGLGLGVGSSLSTTTASDPVIALVATAAPDLKTARERLYANLGRSAIATVVYREDVAAREL